MAKYTRGEDRDELLADVAEMYYEKGLTQAEISRSVKVTRSAISRMLEEARQKGIIEIQVRRPVRFDPGLEAKLEDRFRLQKAHVLVWTKENQYDMLRERLGSLAARVLNESIRPNMTIGVAWGTTVKATIDALVVKNQMPVQVVQLVGVLGSSTHSSNAQVLVQKLANKLGGEGIYLYTPFLVEDEETVRALMNVNSISKAIASGRQCDLALLGIGTTEPDFSSLYQGGHISRQVLEDLRHAGAVGDVSGHHFNIQGGRSEIDLHYRTVAISREDLLNIPIRLGVAGGKAKAAAIVGALRGNYINVLVTDSQTAEEVLKAVDMENQVNERITSY